MNDEAARRREFADRKVTKRKLRKSRLVVEEGPDKGKRIDIASERMTIGESVICDLTLNDTAVSGTHCEIIAKENGFLLRDLGSANGTWVAGVRVREAWLEPGMPLRIGRTVIRFEHGPGTIEIELSRREKFYDLIGHGVRMREIFAVLEKVAASDLTVLVRGETGTGKELVARAIHRASKRAQRALIVQDCSAIPANLIESILFGHERGSFTGAADRKRGCFEVADGGTLFLDEIGELDIGLQPKLLRVLETREVQRVGGTKMIPVDVRVVAATNRDLRQMVNEGTFREDLYYRLTVVQVDLPALRERTEDIPALAVQFLEESAKRGPQEGASFTITDDAMTKLQAYPWPGNVRELKNTIERAVSLADGTELGMHDLMPASQKTPPIVFPGGTAEQFVDNDIPFKDAKQRIVDAFEAQYLKAVLDKHGDNISRSARAAGLTRYHLRELAKRYGLRGETSDPGDED
ncbi:MAG: sigma 54-interacting transcriptional regulator [Deltaproteobacteria bacterium]|nr:sigma 54-interacting transcriptional regulator [Deltaproteobacteria bacterium]NND26991.1 sigma 54-dependent Fis family transcriptional regulator [Myxococcales bacterium]MBT8464534.1 sigma 54-interacting transcriptional regulator [Deltaproteobacteria bacterium]MBT8483090.1 sigma 54-interacting transcriptional regulator [Deltaproteobacteria bacterium]NNK05849.1 sigma 54-dependent Fis family transcriptional regulator [Myxococcales bacterium]